MKFRHLNNVAGALLIAACLTACNNDNASSDAAKNADGTTTTDTLAANKPKPKKSGKVSAALSKEDQAAAIKMDKDGYYTRTEVQPVYASGQADLESYIVNNIVYPQDAIDNGVEGTVTVQFAVDDKGHVSNVTTTGAKLGYGLEEEAVRVISTMPNWTPAKVKGKNVKTWRTLPVSYRLEDF